ncbi:MAG: hypothetical protein MK180_06815 [Rhodobacteraceae bacterium]|nr:hypothetical protein [Paracoccaceae bacterium]
MEHLAIIVLVALVISNGLLLSTLMSRTIKQTFLDGGPPRESFGISEIATIEAQLTEIRRDIDWLTADRMLETTGRFLDLGPKTEPACNEASPLNPVENRFCQ